MPIYEYHCSQCGHELEAIRKMSDPPLRECPRCGAPALEKKVSAAGFRLKGGGWYETDFKSGRQRNVAQADSKEGGKEKKKADTGKAAGGSKDKVATGKTKKKA